MKGRPIFCEHAQSLVQEAWVSREALLWCSAVSSFIVDLRLQTQYSVCLTSANMTTPDTHWNYRHESKMVKILNEVWCCFRKRLTLWVETKCRGKIFAAKMMSLSFQCVTSEVNFYPHPDRPVPPALCSLFTQMPFLNSDVTKAAR